MHVYLVNIFQLKQRQGYISPLKHSFIEIDWGNNLILPHSYSELHDIILFVAALFSLYHCTKKVGYQ